IRDHFLDDLAEIEPCALLAVALPQVTNMMLRPLAIAALLLSFSAPTFGAGERIDLAPGQESGRLSHISIQVDVGGHNLVRPEQAASTEKSAAAEQTLPISVAAKLDYDEKRLANNSPNTGATLAVRYYDQ